MYLGKIRNSLWSRVRRFLASIRFRLTVLYLALMAITLSIFCTVLFQLFVRNHQQEFDFALYNHAVDVGQSISVDFFSGEFYFTRSVLLAREKAFPFSLGKSFAQVIGPDGQIVTRSPNLGDNQLPVDPDDWQTVFLRRSYVTRTLTPAMMKNIKAALPNENYRQIIYMVRRGGPAFVLQIAVPMTLLEKEQAELLRFFLIGIPLSLLLAALAGFYLAGNALKPVREIIQTAAQLNPSNLAARLPETGTEDEISMMTFTLNEFLGRIERAFESHEHFIADASHQLKTPLAILRGELDVFRSKPRSPAEVTAFVDSASQELQHLSRLLDDLLTLSKIEAGAGSLILRKIRLDELLIETMGRFELLARKKGISIRVDLEDKSPGDSGDDFEVSADSDLLLSMFRNLVDNAIKYSPENAPVEVLLVNDKDHVTVKIKDRGDPIPPELAERLFQRYERGNIRVGGVSGTGLGLTIARRIAEMHGGKISISNENFGFKAFVFEMKKN